MHLRPFFLVSVPRAPEPRVWCVPPRVLRPFPCACILTASDRCAEQLRLTGGLLARPTPRRSSSSVDATDRTQHSCRDEHQGSRAQRAAAAHYVQRSKHRTTHSVQRTQTDADARRPKRLVSTNPSDGSADGCGEAVCGPAVCDRRSLCAVMCSLAAPPIASASLRAVPER